MFRSWQIQKMEEYLVGNGYNTIAEWGRDSDYLLAEDGTWVDLDDNHVDLWNQLWYALEANDDYERETLVIDANNWWEFTDLLWRAAQQDTEHTYKRVVWETTDNPLTSGVEWDYDEDDLEYMRVGFITGIKSVFVEIEDGTYGQMNALRVYTGREKQ